MLLHNESKVLMHTKFETDDTNNRQLIPSCRLNG